MVREAEKSLFFSDPGTKATNFCWDFFSSRTTKKNAFFAAFLTKYEKIVIQYIKADLKTNKPYPSLKNTQLHIKATLFRPFKNQSKV